MPNTTAVAPIPFAPTAEILEAAIGAIDADGDRSGSAVDAAQRREALALSETLVVPGGHPGRTWRYNYTKLPYDDLTWSSARIAVHAIPAPKRAPAPAEVDADHPALAVENAGGLVHVGSTLLDAPPRDGSDARIVVMSLADARRAHPDLVGPVQHRVAAWRDDRFAAQATAFQNCGAFVYVPDGVVLDAPIQLLFTTNEADPAAVFPHVVVVLGAGARATVIERYGGPGDAFVNAIVEAHVGERAQLDYVSVQQADPEARVFALRAARCERDATVRWLLAELGGALARSVTDTRLAQPGARIESAALFFTGSTQHVELTTQAIHLVGQTTSDTIVRTAATDRGQGRFFGNIAIKEHAHGSDASLRDDVLLLSKNSHIDSVPALEIAANDVKAFHGATIGSLEDEQLFYALSRGIARPDAMRMIALGFFEPVVSRFPGELLRDEIRTALDAKIDEATELS